MAQRVGFGKLIIGKEKSQVSDGVFAESTSTSEEEGSVSDIQKWKGECSKYAFQRGGNSAAESGKNHSEDIGGPTKVVEGEGKKVNNDRLPFIEPSRTQSLSEPLKEFVDNIEKAHFNDIPKTQSLEGPLKDYLDKIEKAFVRQNFRIGLDHHLHSNDPVVYPLEEETSEDSSISVVKETKSSTESDQSDQAQEKETSSFISVLATMEEDAVGRISNRRKKKSGKFRVQGGKQKEPKMRKQKHRGGEMIQKKAWTVDEEVTKVMEIGVELSLDFKGRELEMADIIRRRELEDADHNGQVGGF